MDHYDELLRNWKCFSQIIQDPIQNRDEVTAELVKRYAEQNIEILNEILLSSIEHLKHLQKVKSLNDIICTQARLTDEIGKKMFKSTQKFFSASLGKVSDYNEWLKSHCDLATD